MHHQRPRSACNNDSIVNEKPVIPMKCLHRKSGHNHFIKNKFQYPRKASCMSCLFRSSTLLTSFMDSLSKTSRSDLKGKRYLWFLNFKIDIYRTLCKNHLSLSTIYVFEPMHFKAYLGKSQVYRCDKT
ncbi:unnamed protein product [Arabidopsis thaliana]|uniref:Uncharacterized protein n=1 Tax=Arabidopsis thaliana TaxID=3702 RepID=A0A654G9Q4_ARATH|nr:unnamed protein product [Arabidopsis thaliana]